MREIVGTDELMQVCKALNAPLRVQILRCILEHGSMNLNAWLRGIGGDQWCDDRAHQTAQRGGAGFDRNRNGRHGVQRSAGWGRPA